MDILLIPFVSIGMLENVWIYYLFYFSKYIILFRTASS